VPSNLVSRAAENDPTRHLSDFDDPYVESYISGKTLPRILLPSSEGLGGFRSRVSRIVGASWFCFFSRVKLGGGGAETLSLLIFWW